MKTIFVSIVMMLVCGVSSAQNFSDYFYNKTLRVDYIFSGNADKQMISVAQLNKSNGWYGKKKRLAELPVQGNGNITVVDHRTGKVIYRNSFSTLFQEWLTYDEAKHNNKSFENVFLMPLPKDTADITVKLYNNRQEETVSYTHRYIPNDVLIRQIGSVTTPYQTLVEPKDTANCIHVAIVAEGYTQEEMPLFINDAQKATESLFAHDPFKTNKGKFQVIAVMSPSQNSGTSIPSQNIWLNTALGSHFDTFYSPRYLTTLHLNALHDVLAGIPYEHILILVNTNHYGGGGILNSYTLAAAHHRLSSPVIVHEFGHSFAGLGDEYAYENEPLEMYPRDVEPWEKNLTTLKNFHGKWENMIQKSTPIPTPVNKKTLKEKPVGVYEGAGYSLKGVYRGFIDCRMKTNEFPEFCPVCQKALQDLIDFYTK